MSRNSKGNRKDSWEDRESRDMKEDDRKGSRRDKFKQYAKRAGANDVSWYIPDVQLLRDVASLPWSEQAGQRPATSGEVFGTKFSSAFPGVAAMRVVPTLGNATKANDAVNQAMQTTFTDIRKNTSGGGKVYGPTDLMIYIMSLDSIYYYTSWITRLYATVNMYAMQNKYLPDLLFAAQGVDGASIRADLPGFRSRVNSLIRKIATLVIPNTMPIFQRHCFLFSNYYTEGTTIKDQIYMYVPDGYYIFGYDANGAGKLTFSKFPALMNANTIIAILEAMVDAIFMEEDFGIMAGDILRAYGESGVQRISLIPDELTAMPVYNYEVLMQFKNAKCYDYNNALLWDIEQVIDPNYPVSPYIVQGPNKPGSSNTSISIYSYTSGGIYIPQFPPFTYSHTDPHYSWMMRVWDRISKSDILVSANPVVTPEESMVSSRLTAGIDFSYATGPSSDDLSVTGVTFGSEWPVSVTYWGNIYFNGTLQQASMTLYKNNVINPTGVYNPGDHTYDVNNPVAAPCIVSNFHYHPEHIFAIVGPVVTDSEDCYISDLPMLDVDNYTHVDYEALDKLHSVAILGEFNVPSRSVG